MLRIHPSNEHRGLNLMTSNLQRLAVVVNKKKRLLKNLTLKIKKKTENQRNNDALN